MEMKVSMTLWLDGSRWLWPLLESELWYSTRLLEDTVEVNEAAGRTQAPGPTPPAPGILGPGRQGHAWITADNRNPKVKPLPSVLNKGSLPASLRGPPWEWPQYILVGTLEKPR